MAPFKGKKVFSGDMMMFDEVTAIDTSENHVHFKRAFVAQSPEDFTIVALTALVLAQGA